MRVGVPCPLGIGQAHSLEVAQHLRAQMGALRPLVGADRFRDLISDPVHRVQRRHRLLEDHRDLGTADLPQPGARRPHQLLSP